MITRRILLTLALVAVLAPLAAAKKKPKAPKATPFDYYVLSLSWSPQHCAETKDTSIQCAGGRRYGFVVHGLWPNALSGKHPANCAGPAYDPSFATPELLKVMPSPTLIQHEWTKHGPCSGLAPTAYFDTVLKAWGMVKIPTEFGGPDHNITTTPVAVRKAFATANPTFGTEGFSVADKGKYLQEVRACLTPALQPRACPDKGDTSTRQIIMRPVR
jgi:ribonuclease T2